ncbi:hydantoinase B/oxoprolinase, partial [Colletotrichum scovillei]
TRKLDQATVALHKLAPAPAVGEVLEAGLEAGNVALDLGGEVGVGGGGVSAGHDLDDGGELGARGDVGEAYVGGELGDGGLVVAEGVAVHEAHGDGAVALVDPDCFTGDAGDEGGV